MNGTDELAGKAVTVFAAGVVTFTSGATGAIGIVTHAFTAAQIPDGYLIALASAALMAGTGMFAWTFKLILQMRDTLADLKASKATNTEAIVELKVRITNLETRLNNPERNR